MDYWEPVKVGSTYHMKCSACGHLIPLFTKEGEENRPDSCEACGTDMTEDNRRHYEWERIAIRRAEDYR